jgi:hypothetical protein
MLFHAFLTALFFQGCTNETPAIFAHEVDDFRRNVSCGGDDIPFIFPVLIIHYNDHFSTFQILNGTFDRIQHEYFFSKLFQYNKTKEPEVLFRLFFMNFWKGYQKEYLTVS